MILIDSIYIHNGGGKEILDLIINYVYKNNLENFPNKTNLPVKEHFELS